MMRYRDSTVQYSTAELWTPQWIQRPTRGPVRVARFVLFFIQKSLHLCTATNTYSKDTVPVNNRESGV